MNDSKQFYLLGVLHNLAMVLRYKKTVDRIIECAVDEIGDNSFPATVVKNVHAIREAMKDPLKGIKQLPYTFSHRDIVENEASLSEFF